MSNIESVDFINKAAQGEVRLFRVSKLPDNLKKVEAIAGKFIVAHSETGHHHVIEADDDVEFYDNVEDDLESYLVVKSIIAKQLVHLREFDTHKTLNIPQGIFKIRHAREATPEGWRQVQD